jgi:hypothetical protein
MKRFRCRIGLHKWVQVRQRDPDLDNPGQSAYWRTTCRYCGCEHGSGIVALTTACVVAVVASIAVFWLLSPLLGAIMMCGAVGGLGWAVVPATIDRVARWLSVGFR